MRVSAERLPLSFLARTACHIGYVNRPFETREASVLYVQSTHACGEHTLCRFPVKTVRLKRSSKQATEMRVALFRFVLSMRVHEERMK